MQFTEIQQISSFSHTSIKDKNNSFNLFKLYNNPSSLKSQDALDEHFFHQVMNNLNQITTAQQNKPLQQRTQPNLSIQIQDKNIRQTNQTDKHNQLDCSCQKKYDRTRSIMFKNSFTMSRSLTTQTKIDNTNKIKVFYFNSPIMKLIPYNKLSTIKQLIKKSLDTYLIQNNDTVRATQPVQKFEMRLPINENDFSPDMNIEPIHLDRILSENMFQTLILVEKIGKKQNSYKSKPTKQYSFDQSNMSYSSSIKSSQLGYNNNNNVQMIKFILMDETYFELIRIDLDKDGTIQRLFKIIQQKNLNNSIQYVIKDDPQSQFDLLKDHQVKLIQKNRLYLMTKKYLDQAQDQSPGPIRLKTLIKQQVNYLPPIGINQASRYQQFQVTKINSLGIAIDRILGIDQTKIYNYQKQLRQLKKQASIMDKFLGLNIQTGTKKPFRLIKDILQVKKFNGGIELVYPDKITTYIIKNQLALQKIQRKLMYLLDINKNISPLRNNSNLHSQNHQSISPKKSTLSFFKF